MSPPWEVGKHKTTLEMRNEEGVSGCDGTVVWEAGREGGGPATTVHHRRVRNDPLTSSLRVTFAFCWLGC
jgi:hypothetical protein